MLRLFLIFIFTIFISPLFGDTRSDNIPQGFQWRYIMNEQEPAPRYGEFWRDGIFLEDKMIILNTHNLIALDFNGKEIWKYGLPLESTFAEAKIIKTSSNEIVVVITSALLRINSDTGAMIESYGYDTRKRSAFQFTELLPRTATLLDDSIFVFLGPELLAFDKESLERTNIYNFNTSPKTIPILFKNQLLVGFVNGFVELFDPVTKKKNTLLYGDPSKVFSVRQPVVQDDLIFIPTSSYIVVYSNENFFARSDLLKDNILSIVDNKVLLRNHRKGTIREIDFTLSTLNTIQFVSDKYANTISSPLVGNSNTMLQIDNVEGQIYVIRNKEVEKVIYAEDFLDNPPLQLLYQKDDKALLGAFDGLYFINLDQL